MGGGITLGKNVRTSHNVQDIKNGILSLYVKTCFHNTQTYTIRIDVIGN